MLLLKSLAPICILAVAAFAVPAQEKRVHHHADLSDHAHDDAHGYQYDHEAFLGKEEAKTFDQLTPEESKDRLAKIVERIDTDKDGFVSHGELHYWIKHRQRRYIEENVNKHWHDYDKNQDGKIGWEEYKNTTYGFYLDEEFDDVEDKATYKSMLTRDERRFKTADRDSDGIATREEFTAFLHPEEFDYMRDVIVQDSGHTLDLVINYDLSTGVSSVVDLAVSDHYCVYFNITSFNHQEAPETMEDIDKNGDGKISLDEYIGDMYTPEAGESEPEWVHTEKKHFSDFRDANKDGYLDASEVAHWVLPGEVDHADNEAKHLIHETDTDKDEKITKKEILANWNMFVGSQATNYGEDLTKRHDEL